MSLSELYGIGKRSRQSVAEIKNASTSAARNQRNPSTQHRLIEIINDDQHDASKDESPITNAADGMEKKQIDSAEKSATTFLHPPRMSRPRCMICRRAESKYNCPNCNIPYCSLDCYRAQQHANCSQPFSRKMMQAELGLQDNGVDEKERKAMMELLRRHRLSEDPREDVDVGASSYEEEAGDEGEEANLEELDLDDASIEQMLGMLTDEERRMLEETISNGNEEKARKLVEKLMDEPGTELKAEHASDLTKPWWARHDEPKVRPATDKIYKSALELSKKTSSNNSKRIDLTYNVICVLLCYVYLVRHLDVESLLDNSNEREEKASAKDVAIAGEDDMPPLESVDLDNSEVRQEADAEKDTLRSVITSKTKRLLPFLDVNRAESKIVMQSAVEASLWVAARLGRDIGNEMAKSLLFLFEDIKTLMRPTRVSDLEAPSKNKIVLAICDLAVHLDISSRRKLIFYAAHWFQLDQLQITKVQQQIDVEMQRLQAELDRAQDEARLAAANEAVEQQIVLS